MQRRGGRCGGRAPGAGDDDAAPAKSCVFVGRGTRGIRRCPHSRWSNNLKPLFQFSNGAGRDRGAGQGTRATYYSMYIVDIDLDAGGPRLGKVVVRVRHLGPGLGGVERVQRVRGVGVDDHVELFSSA